MKMEFPRPGSIPEPAVRRLSLYLRELEKFHRNQRLTISSKQLGESLRLTDAQVRKDLAYFGQFGRPGIGYRVVDLVSRLRHILGTDRDWNVLLVGAGNIGAALASYRGFSSKGFNIVAIFDNDATKIGKKIGAFTVEPLSKLTTAVKELSARLAILAVPADGAQDVADQLAAAGIRGLLNFAPVSLKVPKGVSVNTVDVGVQLEQLAFQTTMSD
jgi:redox-sensing transcriptional repressor